MSAYAYENSATIGSTEYSLPANSTTLATITHTTPVTYQAWLDLNALAAGDTFRFKVYEAVASGGTKRLVSKIDFVGAKAAGPVRVDVPLLLGRGWDMTLQKIAGTDRSIVWSIRSA